MRFFGLGAQVMQKLGVSTQLLAPPDIYPALERGVIDATEFAMPNMDIKLGFHQMAKYNYYPGWHQPASVSELLMNKAAFEALPESYQTMLEAACGWNIHVTYAETEAMNPPAMNEMLDEIRGAERALDRRELAAFEQAWDEVLAEQSAADPTVQEGRRQLSRVPQGVQGLGRRPGDEGHLPGQLNRTGRVPDEHRTPGVATPRRAATHAG